LTPNLGCPAMGGSSDSHSVGWSLRVRSIRASIPLHYNASSRFSQVRDINHGRNADRFGPVDTPVFDLTFSGRSN